MQNTRTIIAVVIMLLILGVALSAYAAIGPRSSAIFTCGDTRADVEASGAESVDSGALTLFIGYRQVSATNQNPILAAFDGTTQVWCREDYDTSPADSRGYGLVEVNGDVYAVFTADGGNVGLTNFTGGGWLPSYGSGGGPSVSVVLRLDPATGDPTGGTFIIARLTNGDTNSANVEAITADGTNVAISGVSAFGPLDENGDRNLNCTANEFTYVLSPDLSTIISASCPGDPANTPTPTPTRDPNATATFTPTPTPTAERTQEPDITFTPTPTATFFYRKG